MTDIGKVDIGLEAKMGFDQKNKFSVGDVLEIMQTDAANLQIKVSYIIDEFGNKMESAPHPKQKLKVFFDLLDESQSGSVNIKTGLIIRRID